MAGIGAGFVGALLGALLLIWAWKSGSSKPLHGVFQPEGRCRPRVPRATDPARRRTEVPQPRAPSGQPPSRSRKRRFDGRAPASGALAQFRIPQIGGNADVRRPCQWPSKDPAGPCPPPRQWPWPCVHQASSQAASPRGPHHAVAGAVALHQCRRRQAGRCCDGPEGYGPVATLIQQALRTAAKTGLVRDDARAWHGGKCKRMFVHQASTLALWRTRASAVAER